MWRSSDDLRWPSFASFGNLCRSTPFSLGEGNLPTIALIKTALQTIEDFRTKPSGSAIPESTQKPPPGPALAALTPGNKAIAAALDIKKEGKAVTPPADPLTLDDRAVALLTRWIKEGRPKVSRRALAKTLGCHHSSLDDCPTFLRLWETSRDQIKRGFINATTGQIETVDDD
jgi:hypothetical protein